MGDFTLDLVDGTDPASIEEHSLAEGGFSRVDMSRYSNISEVGFAA